jgi:hypothetical protein
MDEVNATPVGPSILESMLGAFYRLRAVQDRCDLWMVREGDRTRLEWRPRDQHHAPNSVGADSPVLPAPEPVKIVDRRPYRDI